VILSELLTKVKTAYGQELSMNYVGNEVHFTVTAYFVVLNCTVHVVVPGELTHHTFYEFCLIKLTFFF